MKKKIIAVAIVAILLIAYIGRVYQVNANAYRIKEQTYQFGEICEYRDFNYQIQSCELLSQQQVEERFNIHIDNNLGCDINYFVIAVGAEYIGKDSTGYCQAGGFSVKSRGWSNGCDATIYNNVNKNSTTFTKNETKTLYVFGACPEGQFTESEWKNRSHMSVQVVLTTFPTELVMKCQ